MCGGLLRRLQKSSRRNNGALHRYLALSAGAVRPQDVVDAALLLESLASTSADETSLATSSTAGASRKDFVEFVARFPVSPEGQPPSKKQRVESGFPVFYDKWRTTKYAQREEYLLSHFTGRWQGLLHMRAGRSTVLSRRTSNGCGDIKAMFSLQS